MPDTHMMKRLKKIILTGLLLPLAIWAGGLNAQTPVRALHDKVADTFKTLYNEKKFGELYQALSPDFQSTMKQSDFTAFLEQSIYLPMDQLQQLSYLSNEKGLFSYVAYFKQGPLRMDLAVNAREQIDGLEFSPYRSGINIYYSTDNKKQGPLDLFVDSVVASYMQNPQNCGLSIGISVKGQKHFYNYGEIMRGTRRLPQSTTIYEIGSITKTFCGLLLAQAILEKKIKADDDIRNYLAGSYPDLASGKKPILVKHLANHTSGLPGIPEDLMAAPGYDSLNPYQHYSRDQIFKALKTMRPEHEPGTVCAYSNLGMALLGLILEDLYHQPFELLVKEKITLPNQMLSTGVRLNDEQLNRFALGYNQAGDATPHWELGGFAAAGALRSTAEDLLNYLDYNLAEADEMTKLAHRVTYSGRETLGMAWFIKKTKQGNTLLWHNGGTFGFSSFGGFIREKKCSLILLSNSGWNADAIAIAILNYLQR
jgi:CubicO group peptidase (beta-lactamase class C family)